jgi:Chalcone isomerase-like
MKPCPNLPRRTCLAALGALLIGAANATSAQTTTQATAQMTAPEVSTELSGAKLSGQGKLTYFGLHVYDARLWVQDGFKAADFVRVPLALELEYARTLYGKLIAERSLDEMKRVGDMTDAKATEWLTQLKALFTDVNKGDRITGIQVPGVATRIFVNGKLRGEVRDADFTRLFFGIWLSPRTSEPKLRDALLGPARSAQ